MTALTFSRLGMVSVRDLADDVSTLVVDDPAGRSGGQIMVPVPWCARHLLAGHTLS
ncbi:hypothetical protein [Actinomadura montaniterrae]|uniref:hypothetical protein n=1 Tax=Actinomadura montaniterrae TaxID=1803903 RepID=UPI00178C1EFB|nr:hypothetical protein [Actinomadura montaniterrae]